MASVPLKRDSPPLPRGALVRLVLEMRDGADALGRNLAAEPAEVRARELLRAAADVLEDVSRQAEDAAAASPPLRTAGGGSFSRPPAWLGPQVGAQDKPPIRLADLWQSYAARVVPHEAGAAQRRETRRAFYGGVAALIGALFSMLSDGDEITSDDLAVMTGLQDELATFLRDVAEGRA